MAVEVNEEVIPRSEYADHVLGDGDRLEIVHAVGGGLTKAARNTFKSSTP